MTELCCVNVTVVVCIQFISRKWSSNANVGAPRISSVDCAMMIIQLFYFFKLKSILNKHFNYFRHFFICTYLCKYFFVAVF